MKKEIDIRAEEPLILLADEFVYGHRRSWCDAVFRPLRMSIMRPREFFDYDKKEVLPLIVFLCGGGFTEMDRNVWTPEIAWFAKRGYAVASVEYSVTARTRFPEQIEDVKQAIRFIRANSELLGVDPQRIAVMGESGGGYLSALVGVTGDTRIFDQGLYLEQSSAVQAAVPFYPAVTPSKIDIPDPGALFVPPDINRMADIPDYISAKTPPFCILHGDADSQVPVSQSDLLFEALSASGVDTTYYRIRGAEHADARFFQSEVKQLILDFLNRVLS